MTYNIEGLRSWEVFYTYSFAVWQSAGVWHMAKRLVIVSVLVACAELLFASDPSSLNPLRFAQIGVTLNVFVGLLLGFYLTSSTKRWFSCVSGFLGLANSVRNLHMQLHALGVSSQHIDLALRYSVVSAWLLNFQMKSMGMPLSARPAAADAMWQSFQSSPSDLSKLLPEEVAKLRGASDYPGLIWIWVASLMGRLAQDGEIPPMSSPTYGRVIALAQDAQAHMRMVRSSVVVQMPFAYVHTLATIVHINNILSAVSFGLTLGAAIGSMLVHINPHLHLWNIRPHPGYLLIEDVQFVIIQFFKCFIAPIVYQSFFEIGLAISQPFTSADGAIPVERLLRKLEADLQDGDRLASTPPHWERPQYKNEKPAVEPSVI